MSDWSISKRIGVLSVALVAALLLAIGVGMGATLRLAGVFSDYRHASTETIYLGSVMEDTLEARADELHFRLDGDASDAENFRLNISEIVTIKQEIMEGDQLQPDTLAALDGFVAAYAGYAAAFEEAVTLEGEFQAVANEAAAQGTAIRERLQRVMDAGMMSSSMDMINIAAAAKEHFLFAMLYLERSMLHGRTEDLNATAEEFGLATAALDRLAGGQDVDVTREARALLDEAEQMGATIATAGEIIARRAELRSRIDILSTELAEPLDLLVERLDAAQIERSSQADTIVGTTLAALLAVAAVAIAASVWMATVVTRRVRADVARSVTETQELASGNLSVEITGADKDHELGQLAKALSVFRANAVAAREAEAAQKEQERAQREREAERDRIEAEESERLRRKAAEERQAMLRRLQASIGAVVDGAATGDFSRRIGERFEEEEFNRMADGVNRLMSNVEAGVKEVSRVMSGLAAGDLTGRMSGSFAGAFAELQANVNDSLGTLAQVIDDIARECDAVMAQVDRMTEQSGELARRAEQQAASLEETSAAMEEISVTARSSAEGAANANDFARKATGRVDEAGRVVASAVGAMGDIRAASTRIGEIVSVIEGIAFQTNLLALNASVEAARAGSAGKGFAVVATEVRALAQRSSTASQDIKALIDESAAQVNRGVGLVEETGTTLKEIVEGVRQMAGSLGELVTAGKEQAVGVQEVTTAISQLDVITQKNAALADQSRDLANDLKTRTQSMEALVATFRTGTGRDAGRGHARSDAARPHDGWQAA